MKNYRLIVTTINSQLSCYLYPFIYPKSKKYSREHFEEISKRRLRCTRNLGSIDIKEKLSKRDFQENSSRYFTDA